MNTDSAFNTEGNLVTAENTSAHINSISVIKLLLIIMH